MTAPALRLLQIYPKSDYFTGAAIQAWEVTHGLHRRGHHVVAVSRPNPVWAAKCREAGIPHYELPLRRGFDLGSVRGLRRIAREERIEIAHAHKGIARTLMVLAGVAGPRPRLVLNRGVSFPPSAWWGRLGYTTRRVDAVVAVCDSIRRGLVAAGVPEAKISVVYSGTDTSRFHPGVDGAPVRRELGLAAGDLLVTQVGVRSWRGWRDVLAAVARLPGRCAHVHLLFLGAKASHVETVTAEARALGVADRVLLLPPREEVPAVLRASDLVVDASWAGLGITGSIREAMACERPVVASALEGMPELIADGETGLLVPPRRPQALADAIVRILDAPAWAASMARAGRARVEKAFSSTAKLDGLEALYRRLAAAGP